MSVDYAAGLSEYDDLGVCGVEEVVDLKEELSVKIEQLVKWIEHYRGSCIVHVGAGISTSAGIPDFRGPSGVWTKKIRDAQEQTCAKTNDLDNKQLIKQEQISNKNVCDNNIITQDKKPVSFDDAVPTYTHLALKHLIEEQYLSHIVSQNVDGLFLKANLRRSNINELHGNFYLDECTKCRSRFIRSTASPTMGLKKSLVKCPKDTCKGYLRDTILDWESPIPHNELRGAKSKSKKSKLHICIGTTMQLMPANQLPLEALKGVSRGKLVIINLQPTKLDAKAHLVIHGYADEVMRRIVESLNIKVSDYDPTIDPTKRTDFVKSAWKTKES